MKYCQNCGNTASDNAEYCSVCGTAFDDPRPGEAVSRETVYVYESVPEFEPELVSEERVSAPVIAVHHTSVQKESQKRAEKKESNDSNKAGGSDDSIKISSTGWVIIIVACIIYLCVSSCNSNLNRHEITSNSNSSIAQSETSTSTLEEAKNENTGGKKESFLNLSKPTENAPEKTNDFQVVSTDTTTNDTTNSSTEVTYNLSDSTRETLDELNNSWNEVKDTAKETWGEIKDAWNTVMSDDE